MKIAPGCLVTLHFEIRSRDGELIESSLEGDVEPLVAQLGSGVLPPGLEAALEGRQAGDQLELLLTADEAYGPHDPESVIAIPRSDLPPGADIQPGDLLPLQFRPEEGEGDDDFEEVEVPVVAVEPDAVIIDLNNPLAGQDLHFKVQVLAVEADPDAP